VIKTLLAILLTSSGFVCMAQVSDSLKKAANRVYDRKEEIIYDGKRYRIHNNYLSIGGGFLGSTIRESSQRMIAVDFQFPVKWQHVQAGGFISGQGFTSDNNNQLHLAIGKRKENKTTNFAVYLGPSYSWGVEGEIGSPPRFYRGFGGYISAQAITKLTYDIGLGLELFSDISRKQQILGFKVITFFSSAYRGEKRNYNPNVRSENPE
jgi:hypothetical protein